MKTQPGYGVPQMGQIPQMGLAPSLLDYELLDDDED